MARTEIEREFRTSKMADGSHYVKNFKNKKVAYRSEMATNAIESEFQTSKMACRSEIARNAIKLSAGGHFVFFFKIKQNSVLI